MEPPPLFPADTWHSLATYLRHVANGLPRCPRAILVCSAHWSASEVTVNTAPRHSLFFDYYGFPPSTYELRYPAKGSPEVASEVMAALNVAGIACDMDAERGLDHGVFVPFMLIYPAADVPIVEMSLKDGLDARGHIKLGQALRSLREQDILIVGSGMSYHNISLMIGQRGDETAAAFDGWLQTAVLKTEGREDRLARWFDAPGGREAHPSDDHLLPLMVAVGAAYGARATVDFNDRIAGKAVSAFRFD